MLDEGEDAKGFPMRPFCIRNLRRFKPRFRHSRSKYIEGK